MSYTVGSPVTLTVQFLDEAGDLTDPTAITLTWGDGQDTPDSDTFPGGSGAITKIDVGEYRAVVVPARAGRWVARWVGTGAYPTIDEEEFDVSPSIAPWETDSAPTYATYSEFRDYLRTEDRDELNEDVLRSCLADASRFIEEETGRTFYAGPEDEVRYFTAYTGEPVTIEDAITIAEVAVDYAGSGDFAEALDPDRYFLFPGSAPYTRIYPRYEDWSIFPAAPLRIRVTGQFGTISPRLRSLARRACLIIAAELYAMRDAPFGVVENAAGGPSQSIRMSPVLKDLLTKLTADTRDWVVV